MKHTAESKLHKRKTTYEEQQDNTCELTLTIKQSKFTSQKSMTKHESIQTKTMKKYKNSLLHITNSRLISTIYYPPNEERALNFIHELL